jgi:hypothetical protein
MTNIFEYGWQPQLLKGQDCERNQSQHQARTAKGIEDINPHPRKFILSRAVKFQVFFKAPDFLVGQDFPQPTHKCASIRLWMVGEFHFATIAVTGNFTNTDVNVRKSLVVGMTNELR